MTQFVKPNDLHKIWADSGDRATPLDSKISTGWAVEIPPRQWFNWLDNRQDRAIAHINQHGISVWDTNTIYYAGKSYVQDPVNGIIYRATVTGSGQQPSTSPNFWTQAFLASNQAGISQSFADGRYVTLGGNLADVPNKAAARSNLGVYSTAEVHSVVNSAVNSIYIPPPPSVPSTLGQNGQYWRNLTSQRSLGVTYTNTTGRAIAVHATSGSGFRSGAMTITISGVVLTGISVSQDASSTSCITAIVPPGATYLISTNKGLANWSELR